jgi:hypothetical protein
VIKGVVKRSLETVASRLDFDDDNIDENMVSLDGDSKFVQTYTAGIDKASKGVEGSLGTVTRLVRIPFKIGFYMTAFILIIMIYLLW